MFFIFKIKFTATTKTLIKCNKETRKRLWVSYGKREGTKRKEMTIRMRWEGFKMVK